MIFEVSLGQIVPQMSGATVECVHARPGDMLAMGSKLVDLSVDLSRAFAQECPPVSYYRVVLREKACLRALTVKPGEALDVGELVALFSTDPAEPLDQTPERALRTTVAGIMHHENMFSGQQL
ncbi:hypothetical protein H7F51_06510 [Novosphingobium flavum]|uniref:Uncharacterized protein n=1 Tax=Novosphingobium flavum TaxID=1778672 RepID=A0A7X1FQM4_9SPHN|nr:hypothetical protein [Novosphingobium flavum]MBC2665164.1 hypothetical protein [Novosphingobium flavum]